MSNTCYILYHNFDKEGHYPYFRAKRWQKYSVSDSTKSESLLLKGEKLYCIFGASVENSKRKQYFLWNVTDVEAVEFSDDAGCYRIYGKARYLKEPLHLNPIEGFESFVKTTCNFIGLQNCYKNPFRKVLETAKFLEPEQMEKTPEKFVYDFENKYGILYRESFLDRKKIVLDNDLYYDEPDIEIPEHLLKPVPKKIVVAAPMPKPEIKHVDVSWVKIGVTVQNAFYGDGVVIAFEKGYVRVKFSNAVKQFAFPSAFDDGYLKRV